jgi:histone deacetylase complex regulatory component SIN3
MFIPPIQKEEVLFYGTQQAYFLVRFYFTLYERFLRAFEISNEFEENQKTSSLNKDEKHNMANERYECFKWILAHLIRGNIESEKYEDFLRSIFGNKAYLMFYIDKIIHTVKEILLIIFKIIITIQKMANDDVSPKVLNLFTETDLLSKHPERSNNKSSGKKKNWPEHVYLAQLNSLTL